MPVDYIALDSSALRDAGWPGLSADLENLLRLAPMFKSNVCVPEAVLLELEDFWRRSHQKRFDKAQAAMQAIEKIARNPELLRQLQIYDVDGLLADSTEDSAALIQRWGIQVIPITPRPVNEFFRMAARKEPPFQEKGVGFKDAVIFFSLIDHLIGKRGRGNDGSVLLALVSGDSDFRDESLVRVARNAGVNLSVVGSVQEMNQRITAGLEDAVKKLVAGDREFALVALQKMQPEIEALLNNQLAIAPGELAPLGLTEHVTIKRIELLSIENVRTSYSLSSLSGYGGQTKIAADLRIRIHVSVSRRVRPDDVPLKVGEPWSPVFQVLAGLAADRTETTDETVDKVCKLEATGVRMNDGYTDLTNLSVRLSKESALYG